MYLANGANPDQTPQNAASEQGLLCLQIFQTSFSKNIQISQPDVPKFETGLFHYIVWVSSFSLQWVNSNAFHYRSHFKNGASYSVINMITHGN